MADSMLGGLIALDNWVMVRQAIKAGPNQLAQTHGKLLLQEGLIQLRSRVMVRSMLGGLMAADNWELVGQTTKTDPNKLAQTQTGRLLLQGAVIQSQ